MIFINKIIFRKLPLYNYFLKCIQTNVAFSCQYVKPRTLCNNYNKNILTIVCKKHLNSKTLICSNLLLWLGFYKDDEEKESELINILKRSILLMQRGELAKAEQMLHIALRVAQNQSNSKGITYVYDLMANLALERDEIDKSEKLFIFVMQRLLSDGLSQEDIKMIHISLKLARIYQLRNEFEKAETGYLWCLASVKKHTDNSDAVILTGVVQDWYGKLLLEKGRYKESVEHLEEAYKICSQTEGANSEKSILLLNDLGTANWQSGDLESACSYLTLAISQAKKVENFDHLGVLYANLGLIRFTQGVLLDAQKYCKEGWRISKKQNNADGISQANYCFEQIRTQT